MPDIIINKPTEEDLKSLPEFCNIAVINGAHTKWLLREFQDEIGSFSVGITFMLNTII